jgi:hypothetical protein
MHMMMVAGPAVLPNRRGLGRLWLFSFMIPPEDFFLIAPALPAGMV